jgi:antimicrobial peptide resistance and lipid A acylation protein PagP
MDRTLALLLVLFGYALSAHADELGLVLNGRAIHLDPPKKLNEANWGLGLEYNYTKRAGWVPFLTASGFKDSNDNPSYYAGGGIKKRFTLSRGAYGTYVDAGAVAFLMTRENYQNNQPFPGILPVLSVGMNRLALNVTYVPDMPEIRAKLQPLVFFQLAYFVDMD